MKHIDLNNKSKEELSVIFKDQKTKLLKLKFELNEKKLKDVSQIKKVKKDIARVLTAMRLKPQTTNDK
ncbi:MAG: 50S ribosomal protein L29 [Candidatus Yanofskybacteria bacterium]|nr:50S ribosomal protein L29 [Candidatus Yanofskybacteria bacterium]